MTELTLLENVQAELDSAGLTYLQCRMSEMDESLTILSDSVTLIFQTKLGDDGQWRTVYSPKDIAHMAYSIQQFADITVLSSPELNTLADYMTKGARNPVPRVLTWKLTFWLDKTGLCELGSDLYIQDHVSQETWLIILNTFAHTGNLPFTPDNLEPQLWKARRSPPVRFLMGMGAALMQEDWAGIKQGLNAQRFGDLSVFAQ